MSFNQGWERYRYGFGWRGPMDDMWFGNEPTRAVLNAQEDSILRILMEDTDGVTASVEYTDFWLGTELENYRLSIKLSWVDNLHDSLVESNGASFSTRDHAISVNEQLACTMKGRGGWWWPVNTSECLYTNLNGIYRKEGIESNFFSGYREAHGLNYSEMRIRPFNYTVSVATNPCKNGAKCGFDGKTSSYQCMCSSEYWGETCQRNAWFKPVNMAALVIGLTFPLFLLCILRRLFCPTKRRNRSYRTEQMHLILAPRVIPVRGGGDYVKHEGEEKPSTKHQAERKNRSKRKKSKKSRSLDTIW